MPIRIYDVKTLDEIVCKEGIVSVLVMKIYIQETEIRLNIVVCLVKQGVRRVLGIFRVNDSRFIKGLIRLFYILIGTVY